MSDPYIGHTEAIDLRPAIDNPGQEWRPVPGWEGLYSVTVDGRVRSEPRNTFSGPKTGKELLVNFSDGKAKVRFSNGDRTAWANVRRVVWAAFVGPIPDGMEVQPMTANAIALCDLALGTRRDRLLRACAKYPRLPAKMIPAGAPVTRAKLKIEDIEPIRNRLRSGNLISDIAKDYGVRPATIRRIEQGHGLAWLL